MSPGWLSLWAPAPPSSSGPWFSCCRYSSASEARLRSSSSRSRKWSRSRAALTAAQYRFGALGSGGLLIRVRVVDRVERGLEQGADLARLGKQALALGRSLTRHRPGLGVRLADHQLGLPLCLVLQVVRGLLRRDERRPQQRLEVTMARELALELLDPVGVVGPLPPDLLERVGDLADQLVDGTAAVAEQAPLEANVVELHRGDGHGVLLRCSGRRARRLRAAARSTRGWPPSARGRPDQAAAGSAGRSAGTARRRLAGTPRRAAPRRCRAGAPRRAARRRRRAAGRPAGRCRSAPSLSTRYLQAAQAWPSDGTSGHGPRLLGQAWLKNPRSSRRARSSAETCTFRGVSRKTLSATRCMPPSSAYVRPLVKSIRRLESSWSAPCRLRITGIPSLNLSAICCASLKLRGITRCTWTDGIAPIGPELAAGAAERRLFRGRSTAVAGAASSGSGSVQSSKSRWRPRGVRRRTFGRSL